LEHTLQKKKTKIQKNKIPNGRKNEKKARLPLLKSAENNDVAWMDFKCESPIEEHWKRKFNRDGWISKTPPQRNKMTKRKSK